MARGGAPSRRPRNRPALTKFLPLLSVDPETLEAEITPGGWRFVDLVDHGASDPRDLALEDVVHWLIVWMEGLATLAQSTGLGGEQCITSLVSLRDKGFLRLVPAGVEPLLDGEAFGLVPVARLAEAFRDGLDGG